MAQRKHWRRRVGRRIARFSVITAGVALFPTTPTHQVKACGSFAAHHAPSVGTEQVLITYDRLSQTEHFVREVTFRKGDTVFGFVVPTPAQPHVFAVKPSPFRFLQASFGFQQADQQATAGADFPAKRLDPATRFSPLEHIGTIGFGNSHGTGTGVAELEKRRVGKFVATVLQATDEGALTLWMTRNGFATTETSAKWLHYYVGLSFYFVAFRYDASASAFSEEIVSETVGLSFATPLPYYPYHEPTVAESDDKRLLLVWYASADAPLAPVAAHFTEEGALTWARPWEEGTGVLVRRSLLERNLGAHTQALLPKGRDVLSIQTFRDQKAHRRGWGDTLLVPKYPELLDASAREARRPLLPLLMPPRESFL